MLGIEDWGLRHLVQEKLKNNLLQDNRVVKEGLKRKKGGVLSGVNRNYNPHRFGPYLNSAFLRVLIPILALLPPASDFPL